jgi:hypothetical protein
MSAMLVLPISHGKVPILAYGANRSDQTLQQHLGNVVGTRSYSQESLGILNTCQQISSVYMYIPESYISYRTHPIGHAMYIQGASHHTPLGRKITTIPM